MLQRQDVIHAINQDYYQSYTSVSCAVDIIRGSNDDSVIAFPLPSGVDPSLMLNQFKYNALILNIYSFVYPGITKNQLFETSDFLTESWLKWIELSQDPFNGSAIEAVILLPRSNLTQEILVCNVGAGWGSSLINTSSFDDSTTFVTSVVNPSDLSARGTPMDRSDQDSQDLSTAEAAAESWNSGYYLPFFPQKPIIIIEAWANFLNPFVSALNTTMIDALMSTNKSAAEMSSLDQIDTAKWALAGLLINGLANIGATGALQGDIKTKKSNGSIEWDEDYWFFGKGIMLSSIQKKARTG